MHFQVVEWVSANVPDTAWVAAVQSGTLGYFHDRTINLDGKVNPEALRARRFSAHSGGIPHYVLEKRVDYLIDWVGLAAWADLPALRGKFTLLVADPDRGQRGLAVLTRTR